MVILYSVSDGSNIRVIAESGSVGYFDSVKCAVIFVSYLLVFVYLCVL